MAGTNLFNVPYTIPNGNTQKPAAKPAAKAPSQNGVYWIGQDGKVYVKGGSGTNAAGMADGNTANYWGSRGFAAIDNPNVIQGQTQMQNLDVGTPGDGGGGGGGPVYQDTTAARGATQKNIDAVDTGYNNSIAGINSEYTRIMKQYTDEEALNDAAYTTQVTGNENTRQNNIQSSLLSGAQGGKGLRATLSSLGALNGTGKILASRAVASETNKDIGAGDKVFEANATQLNTAKAKTDQDEENRKNEATAAKASQEAAAKREAAKNRQSLYKDMAGLFSDAGNFGEANNWTNKVGDLAKDVVGGPVAAAEFKASDAKFDAGVLKNYLAGANDMTVKAGGAGTPLNSPLYAITRKREEEVV